MIASVQSGPRGDLACPVLDQRRTARLLFDAELSSGRLAVEALKTPGVIDATRVRGVPVRPLRLAAQVRRKLRGGDLEDVVVEPLAEARRRVLGAGASAPPRFLVRVDEFPHYQAWDDPVRFGTPMFERFHEIMAGAGVPYLIAALPRLSREPLSPEGEIWRGLEDEEIATLQRIAGEGATLALHGRDHRTRFGSPRRHSEMCGLGPAETAELLDQALAELAPHGIRPRVFVPPYNRFDASQYEALAARFEVVCGGPESIGTMGLHATPQWRGEAVYLPAYAPFYGHAEEVLPAAERALERADGLWLPVVLHWGWEMEDGWGALERLAARIAGHAARWEDFLDAVARSEQAA